MQSQLRTAYVHIGSPKAGSSAIQAALFQNAELLKKSGYQYLDGGPNHSQLLAQIFWNDADAVNMGKHTLPVGDGDFFQHRKFLLAQMSDQIDRMKANNLIISAENLSGFRPDEVKRFISFLNARFDKIRIIGYFREPQNLATSIAQQRLKWQGVTLEHCFDNGYAGVVRKAFNLYLEAVGHENFDLRAYHESGQEFDVVQDFSNALGLDHSLERKLGDIRVNSAMSHRAAIALSAVNEASPLYYDHRVSPFRPNGIVRNCILLPGPKFVLPTEVFQATADYLQEERDWFNELAGKTLFRKPPLPEVSRDHWYTEERDRLEEFALAFLDKSRRAQNETALRNLLNAQKFRKRDKSSARKFLTNAWKLSTDHWSMKLIASEADKIKHPDQQLIVAKENLMRRIEHPKDGDPPLNNLPPFRVPPQR